MIIAPDIEDQLRLVSAEFVLATKKSIYQSLIDELMLSDSRMDRDKLIFLIQQRIDKLNGN